METTFSYDKALEEATSVALNQLYNEHFKSDDVIREIAESAIENSDNMCDDPDLFIENEVEDRFMELAGYIEDWFDKIIDAKENIRDNLYNEKFEFSFATDMIISTDYDNFLERLEDKLVKEFDSGKVADKIIQTKEYREIKKDYQDSIDEMFKQERDYRDISF